MTQKERKSAFEKQKQKKEKSKRENKSGKKPSCPLSFFMHFTLFLLFFAHFAPFFSQSPPFKRIYAPRAAYNAELLRLCLFTQSAARRAYQESFALGAPAIAIFSLTRRVRRLLLSETFQEGESATLSKRSAPLLRRRNRCQVLAGL